MVYVLADQLDQDKLSKNYDVKRMFSVIRCVYAHLTYDWTKTGICAYTRRNEWLHHKDIMRSEEGIRNSFKDYSKQTTTNHQINYIITHCKIW